MRQHGIIHRPILLLALFIGFMLISQAEVYAADATSQPAEPIKSVRYKSIEIIRAPNGTELKMERVKLYVNDEWMTDESTLDGKSLTSVVMDLKTHRALSLNRELQRANLLTYKVDEDDGRKSRIGAIAHVDVSGAKDLGEKTIQGRRAHGYLILPKEPSESDPETTVWLDTETRLPLKTETRYINGRFKGNTSQTFDYEWNVQVNPSILTITPPEGYTVENMTIDVSRPTEQTPINFIKTLAAYNDGPFPEMMDEETMGQILNDAHKRHPENKDLGDDYVKTHVSLSMTMSRVQSFIANKKFGTDWHYAGKGAKLGDKNRPIMWYKPAGKETYRVIDAELNVHDVPANELPKIDSVPMTQPAE